MVKKYIKTIEYLFLGLLLVQIGFVIKFNLSDIRCSLDTDVCNTFYYFAEMIKHGTLRLPDWYYTTTMELDGSFLLALPIYFLTGDLFTAVGISNIIMMFLYLVILYLLLHHEKIEKVFIYITLCLVITPYAYSMLDYFNMLFYGGGCYAIKVLVPLLFLLILSLLSKKVYVTKAGKVELALVSLLYIFFLFMTSLSTGIYSILCGICPILIWFVLEVFIDGKFAWKEYVGHYVTIGVTAVTFVVGQALYNKMYGSASRTNMRLTKLENYAVNFRACLGGIFQTLGATTEDDIEALSVQGIVLCVKMLFVVALLVSLFFVYKKFKTSGKEFAIKNFLAFMFVWNFFILLVADARFTGNTNTEYRYFLIGIVPLIIMFGIQLSNLNSVFNQFQKGMAYLVLFFFCCVLVYGNNKNVIDRWDRTTYATEICDYVDTLGVESVIFLDDKETGQFCKGLDNDHKYGIFLSESQSMHFSIDSYYASQTAAFYGDSHVLFVIQGDNMYEKMPAEVADSYTFIDSFKWFDVYLGEQVRLVP